MFESIERYGDMCLHALVDLSRRFGRDELVRAVRATIADLPVMGCRYERRTWRDQWVPIVDAPSAMVHVDEAPADLEAATLAWVRRPIDVSREPPWRLVSLGRGDRSRMILTVSHVVADGGGTAALAHVFGSHLYGVAPSVPVARHRSLARALGGLRWFHLPVLARDVVATFLLPLQAAAIAPRTHHYPAGTTGEPSWRHLVIRSDELDRLKERCGTSVNDLLIAAVARVTAGRTPAGPALVMYTMDLRRYAGAPALTVANTSAILSVQVPRDVVGELRACASKVALLTRRHRSGLYGPAYVLAPMILGALAPHALARRVVHRLAPILVDLPLRRGLVFTNVGRIDDGVRAFGDDIERVRVVGPFIDSVPVPSIVAFGFRGELHLQLFAARTVAPEALALLEDELVRALELDRVSSARRSDAA